MSVNLLPNKSRLEFRKLKMISLARSGSFVFAGTFLLVLAVTFFLNIYYSGLLKKNAAGLLSSQSQYSQYADKIDELQSLRFRVKMVAGVLDERQTVSGRIKEIKGLIGVEAVISRMKINYEKADISGTIDNYAALSLVEKRIEKENKNEQSMFKEITFSSLGQEEDGSWSFYSEFIFIK